MAGGHLFFGDQSGGAIQPYCAMIVCMPILISAGEKPLRSLEQMVWHVSRNSRPS
jgi:hypothetical protein